MLQPGTALVMCTDGLVERRSQSLEDLCDELLARLRAPLVELAPQRLALEAVRLHGEG